MDAVPRAAELMLARTRISQPDGRSVLLYGQHAAPPASYLAPERSAGEFQRRWNPLRQEWVLVAAGRQGRTFLPAQDACPLCASNDGHSSEVPASSFEIAVFDNRFPAMVSGNNRGPGPDAEKDGPQPGGGVCEVVVYTDRHDDSFGSLEKCRLHQLVEVWTDRYQDLGSRSDVGYVYIFENRGEAVGVTLHHPHGQIYGYPFIPPVAETELRAGRAHIRATRGCLQCQLVQSEVDAEERLLFVEGGFAAYVPNYARWPYEVHVAPIGHVGALPDLLSPERGTFGEALQRVARAYDRLFDLPMPYMMAMHQRPTDGRSHPEAHLHVEFYPVLRMAGRLKYLAGGECGAGTFVSDGLPEEKAAEVRKLV
jgi:UDPglucose--hexose-1-phosphate uridylyltransferase